MTAPSAPGRAFLTSCTDADRLPCRLLVGLPPGRRWRTRGRRHRARPARSGGMLILGLTGWLGCARVVRGMALSPKAMPDVEAARAIGGSPLRIALPHGLPGVWTPVIVLATQQVGRMMRDAWGSLGESRDNVNQCGPWLRRDRPVPHDFSKIPFSQ